MTGAVNARWSRFGAVGVVCFAACACTSPPPVRIEPPLGGAAFAPTAAPARPTPPPSLDSADSDQQPISQLPSEILPGEFSRVRLPGYRFALVIHGGAETRRALIYLHGVCGNVERIRDWAAAAASQVTTIALYGNKPCPTASHRSSWNQDIEFIHQLAQLALEKVAEARGGLLDVDRAVVFGYSQGASRAERLVAKHPEHYPWLIMGGPPAPPLLENVRHAAKSAILVGSEEHQDELRAVAANLTSGGAPTRFDVFDGVGHGGFGPDSPSVMTTTLNWLLSSSSPAKASLSTEP